jgi:hypothetical protein
LSVTGDLPTCRWQTQPSILHISDIRITRSTKEELMFVELMPLLKERALLITVARVDEKVKVKTKL